MDKVQLRDNVIVPVISALGMNSPSAVLLLMATAAQETNLGEFIVQQRIGVAGGMGIYQCEKIAYDDTWDRAIGNSISMKAKVRLLCGYEIRPNANRMITDLMLATIICRLKYSLVPEALPDAKDIAGLAAYWKKWYNGPGKGTEQEFIANFKKYVVG